MRKGNQIDTKRIKKAIFAFFSTEFCTDFRKKRFPCPAYKESSIREGRDVTVKVL